MRFELAAHIEPLRSKIENTAATALLARDEMKSLNELLTPVAASVTELLRNQATLSERVGQLESQSSTLDFTQLEKMQLKLLNANDQAYQQLAIIGFKTGSAEQRIIAAKQFITAEGGRDVQCRVTNDETGAETSGSLQKPP